MKFYSFLLIISSLILSCSNSANNKMVEHSDFTVETVFSGHGEVVWGFDFLSENEILLTERSGDIYLHNIKSNETKEVTGGPDAHVQRQGGMLDILFHRIGDKLYVYLTYSEASGGGSTVSMGRGEWSSEGKILNFERLFQAKAIAPPGRHYGSRLRFDDDGHLFMTVGDRGQRDKAQELDYHHGSVLRLTADGKTAEGNPFIGNNDALDEIWSYGHRNQQGLDLHPQTRELWTVEFGPKGGDEVNLIKPGLNYGWPKMTHGREYSGAYIAPSEVEGMEPAIIHFTPAISPSGMTFYTGDVFAQWEGNLFLAALGDTHIHRLVLKEGAPEVIDQERLLDDLNERVRQIRQGPEGYLYFSTDSGKIMRLKPRES